MKNIIRLLSFFLLFTFCLLAENDTTIAIELFEKAKLRIKNGEQNLRKDILSDLRKARKLLLNSEKLSPEQENVLSKINSHIYWQVKFGTIDEIQTESKIKGRETASLKIKKTDSSVEITDPEWALKIQKRKDEFAAALEKVKAYEKKHFKDHYSNLLNYLDLHHKVINEDDGKKVISKTQILNNKILEEKMLTVNDAIAKIYNYDQLIAEKDYATIVTKIISILKYKKLSPKAKDHIKQLYYETLAMRYLKDTLIMTKHKAIPLPKNTIKGYSGVIIDITDTGLSMINEASEKSSVGWNIISEEYLLQMAQFLLTGKTNKETHILAFANMRLHNYKDAFKHFKQLIKTDTGNIIRYKDYLTKCEAGYRLHIGPKIDRSCERAKSLVSKGNKRDAIQLMLDLFEKYSNDDLGKAYQERILFTYSSIIRT